MGLPTKELVSGVDSDEIDRRFDESSDAIAALLRKERAGDGMCLRALYWKASVLQTRVAEGIIPSCWNGGHARATAVMFALRAALFEEAITLADIWLSENLHPESREQIECMRDKAEHGEVWTEGDDQMFRTRIKVGYMSPAYRRLIETG